MCDLEHAVYELRHVPLSKQYVRPLSLSLFLPLSLLLLWPGGVSGPFLFYQSFRREKSHFLCPFRAFSFQRGSINLSLCKRRTPQATNDLLVYLVYLFQYFRLLTLIGGPSGRVQGLVGKTELVTVSLSVPAAYDPPMLSWCPRTCLIQSYIRC